MADKEFEAIVAQVIAEQMKGVFERVERRIVQEVERAVAAKPLPPFVPPMPWAAARFGAGSVVRHRNGIFSALRDTDSEPGVGGDGAWLPLVVGVASVSLGAGKRELLLDIEMSDGNAQTITFDMPIPIYRGIWQEGENYATHDQVSRKGSIYSARSASVGVPPGTDSGATHWQLAVKNERGFLPVFRIDPKGVMTCTLDDDVRDVGSIRDLLVEALREALPPEFQA